MYNELWRRSIIQEGLTKDSMTLTNVTRRETQDSLRSVMQLMRRSCSTMSQPAAQQCNFLFIYEFFIPLMHRKNKL